MTVFEKVYDFLYEKYGPQGWWPLIDRHNKPMSCLYVPQNTTRKLSSEERFEICVGAILTQNTNWTNAEKALVSLIESNFLDPARLGTTEASEIAPFIASSGYFNQKAKKLKSFASFYCGDPEPDRDLFLAEWGLGPETVDDMLLYAYDQPVFVVDLYTKRLFSRLGLCDENVPYHTLQAMISNGLEKNLTLYKEYHALIVRHAKEYCRKKPDCGNCDVIEGCRMKGIPISY